MRTLRRFGKRLHTALRSAKGDEFDAEMASHIEMLTEDNQRRGMTPDAARRAALVTFGGVAQTKESYRDQLGLPWLDALRQDVRHALRGMAASPGFTAVALACLALGIGANTAIFTLFNAVMLKSLPVRQPEQLVQLRFTLQSDTEIFRKMNTGYNSGHSGSSLPYRAFAAMRQHESRSLAGVFAYVPFGFNNRSLNVTTATEATAAGGAMVSGNCFTLLGVPAALGRVISDADLAATAPNVAVISDAFWSRWLGRDPSVIGRAIRVNNVPFTIVGVAPRGFFGLNPGVAADIWLPLRDMPGVRPWGAAALEFNNPQWWWCMVFGRLNPGATIDQARSELDVTFQQTLAAQVERLPPPSQIPHIALNPVARGLEDLQLQFSALLHILMVAVALVLLIACANLSVLLLARASARTREIAIRLAIGASRGRLVRQFLTESTLLSFCGGILGLLFARFGSQALLLVADPSGGFGPSLRPDATVLAFTAGICVLTGILFGLAPALRAARMQAADTLKEQSTAASPKTFPTKALVSLQVALSVSLLFGAGLLVRTLQKLDSQDFGFRRDHLLLFQIDPLRGGYQAARVATLYPEIVRKLEALPGVRNVTMSANALLSGWMGDGNAATDDPAPSNEVPRRAYWNYVGPDFLETMGIPLALGRGIGWREIEERNVVVINQSMARRFFPGQNPLGHRLSFDSKYDPAKSFEIVGVANDAKYESVRGEPHPTAYVPYSFDAAPPSAMFFEVRTFGDPLTMSTVLRKAIRALDPNLPLIGLKTQNEQARESLSQERILAQTSGFLAALALLLVVVGLYGTLAYTLTRRTAEIGIRMALGALPKQILWMVLGESLLVIACGLALGLPVALAVGGYIKSVLFGVTGYDPSTIAATLAILVLMGVLAALLPAQRAARIDPMKALRTS